MQIITTTEQFEEFCLHLHHKQWVTIDTEFIRQKTYYPELCLVQMASDTDTAIIDVLAQKFNCAPLWDVLANPDLVKVLHSAFQDLEIFYHLSPKPIENIFDTQIASMALGYGDSIGYDRLVKDICDVELDKTSRYTDWSLRPLHEAQLQYALQDVTWLRDVYLGLVERLQMRDRMDIVLQEIKSQLYKERFLPNPMQAYKRIKVRRPKADQLVVLQHLAAWRDETARQRNRIRQHVITDDVLIRLAMLQPKNTHQMSKIQGISASYPQSAQAETLIKLIEHALRTPKNSWPKLKKTPRLTERTKTSLELLKMLLRIISEQEEISARLIAENDDLIALIEQKDRANIDCLKGWRKAIFGDRALALLEGKIAIGLHKGQICFTPIQIIDAC